MDKLLIYCFKHFACFSFTKTLLCATQLPFKHYEKNLSAQQNKKSKDAWFSCKKLYPGWEKSTKQQKEKGETISNGLEWPLSAQYPLKRASRKSFLHQKKKYSTKNILVLSKTNEHGIARIGVAIRKKDTKLAVDRNNIKRKIKGSFLSKVLELPPRDFVVYVKKNLKGKEKDLQKDLEDIWNKFLTKQ